MLVLALFSWAAWLFGGLFLTVWLVSAAIRRWKARPSALQDPRSFARSAGGDRRRLCVLVTGCDSGMGEATAARLKDDGFTVFACVYNPELEDAEDAESDVPEAGTGHVIRMAVDVTQTEKVADLNARVKRTLAALDGRLVGIVNCAGVGFGGSFEHFPEKFWRRQLDVNLFGYVSVMDSMLPILRESVEGVPGLRGRVMCVGTGGGVPAVVPACFAAYMASKWGVEGIIQGLRVELELSESPVDACMINPGVTTPTGLAALGDQLLEQLYKESPAVEKRYRRWNSAARRMVLLQPKLLSSGPGDVATAISSALRAGVPMDRYLVGLDSRISSIVGMMPTPVREYALTSGMHAHDKELRAEQAAKKD
jgi:NAD(P)-dependent dehydrogenase (short-subunit alcohol dehydrogenase family)